MSEVLLRRKNLQRKDIEIMAPVGSYESLMAAIQGGANSVYFGIEQLNMRAKSSNNFGFDDLRKIAEICREHGLKAYLTVNTVLYDHDIPLMKRIVEAAKESKISAIIASDISAIIYAHSLGVEVHISTQLNISNSEALKYYSQYADVAVLARELSMTQVRKIYDTIQEQEIRGPKGNLVEIEMFAHGALCMAVSGKCYLSLHEMNSSANRGACLQTCRKSYIVTEKETGNELEIDNEYIMSPKDLNTINFLNKVIDAGVSVLKIEGRARSPEYVKTVCQCYNEAIESLIDGTYGDEKIANWMERLATVFNRGFWDGYYMGQRLGEWSHKYGSKATKRKMYVGKCTNYFSNIGVAEIYIEANELHKGDEIMIIGPTTGVIEASINEMRVDLKPTEKAPKGVKCSIPVKELIRRNDKLYKVVEVTPELD